MNDPCCCQGKEGDHFCARLMMHTDSIIRNMCANSEDFRTAKESTSDHRRMPSAGQRGVNFVLALAEHFKDGCAIADTEEIQRRADICKVCDFFNGRFCTQCGCPTNENVWVTKVKWRSSKCPEGFW